MSEGNGEYLFKERSDFDFETSVGEPWTRRTERQQPVSSIFVKVSRKKCRRGEEKSSGKGKWITFDRGIGF
eukprot:scaffold106029_cov51-Attheya_sp.AAC.2